MQNLAAAEAENKWVEMGAADPTEAKAALVGKSRPWIGIAAVRTYARMKIALWRKVVGGDSAAAAQRRRQGYDRYWREQREYYERHQVLSTAERRSGLSECG